MMKYSVHLEKWANRNDNNNNNKYTSHTRQDIYMYTACRRFEIIREMGNDPLILSRMNAEMFNGYDDDDDDALN